MKNIRIINCVLICFGLIFISSCKDEKNAEKGVITFEVNYQAINCASNVTIYLDGENIGTLENTLDAIPKPSKTESIAKEVSTGKHSYKAEIRSENEYYTKDITGTFSISENESQKIVIDYLEIFKEEDNTTSNCDQDVIISNEEYENATDVLSVIDMNISGNCLKIKFAASGCSGDTWIVKLIDSGNVMEEPYQRNLKLTIHNEEICMAVPTKEISFNIQDLQISGDNKVLLNIGGKQILYEY